MKNADTQCRQETTGTLSALNISTCKNTVMYFIVDLKNNWRAPDNLIFCSGYETREQCEERLAELQSGTIELSQRRGIPLDLDIE